MFRKLLLSSAALAAMTAGAAAADLPNTKEAPVYKPPPPPPPSWTGFYVGINGGWIGSVDSGIYNTGVDTGGPGFAEGLDIGAIPTSISRSIDGGLVGGTAGYNLQLSAALVVGIEGDIDWVDAHGSSSAGPFDTLGYAPTTTTVSRDLDWLGTLRGRIGISPIAPVFVYATGGLAVGGHQLGVAALGPAWGPPLNASYTTRSTSAGWTLGGGVEWKFAPQWSFKAEYLYVDLGNINSTINYVYELFGAPVTTSLTGHIHDNYNIARVGINYSFDFAPPPAPPVVAKY